MRFRLLVVFFLFAAALRAAPEYPKMGPDIYDTKADGSALVAEAIVAATASHKRIILDLGANWCHFCRQLKAEFEGNPEIKKALEANFIVVYVDVNQRDGKNRNETLNRYYEDPVKEGLPVLVLLEKDGRQLGTQETGSLEDLKGENGYDPKKILAFLTKAATKKP